MTDLRTIVYVSAAVGNMTPAQLESLLTEARKLNLENSITGVLLFCDGNFMQCFEGPAQSMHATFGRILASRKHKNIIELMDERVHARSFEDWQMGLLHPAKSELLALSTANWVKRSGNSDISGSPPPGLALLRSFWLNAQG